MGIELVESANEPIVISPYTTMWASANYYVLAKLENREELTYIIINVDLIEISNLSIEH